LKSFTTKAPSIHLFNINSELSCPFFTSIHTGGLEKALRQHIQIVPLLTLAEQALENKKKIAVCNFDQGTIDGRSGTLALQGN
jgi:hypothetical protein